MVAYEAHYRKRGNELDSVLSILNLEDDPLDTDLARALLHKGGLTAVVDRVDTLEAFKDALHQGCYSLILSDYSLPGLSALEALALSKDICPEMPFIFLTGALGEETAIEMLKLGASDYVLKQRIERLVPAVRRALQEADELARRKKAENALRESETRFRLLFQQAAVGIQRLDAKGRLLEINEKLCDILGYSREELLRLSLADFTYRDDLPLELAKLGQLLAREIPNYSIEKRCLRKDGALIWVRVTASLSKDGDQNPWWFAVVEDITERKHAEEGLLAAQQSAERAKAAAEQANQAKDHFLAVLSHELRTPLTPVVMGVSMLQRTVDLDAKARETLEMVRRNVEMEARLIDDLLDVSRIARNKIELNRTVVDLRTVIQRAVEVCQPDIDAKHLQFAMDLGADTAYWVDIDVARMQQVFWNLLKNAVKFTPKNGRANLLCGRTDGQVLVELSDSGIGIEAESVSRVFNAFEQADRSITQHFGGLGLGLAISKALVEAHGGSISARSDGKDRGATFSIRLPLATPPGEQSEHATATAKQPALHRLQILVAEDHGVTAKLMRMMLANEGHTVELAGDVAAALKLAEQQTFDLLISDLGLPDGSGHDLIRKLRAQGHAFPAIALSGYGQEEDIQRSRQAGFSAHLTKPASREKLIETIAAVVNR